MKRSKTFTLRTFALALATCVASSALSLEARAEATIVGNVEAKADCANAPMEAWLSLGTTLLYQVDVPQHGTFEFHVNSGSYNLVVVGATGCLAEAEVEARENDTRSVTLSPTQAIAPPKSGEKKSALDWLVPSAQADCPFCNQGWYVAPPVSFMPMDAPWWMGFGAINYPQSFYTPAPWLNGGINGRMFPGTGAMFGDKPVLYVNGPDGTPIKIHAHLSDSTHWLVTVPQYGEKAWSGEIRGNHLLSAGADYRYVYYDYRGDDKKFQDTSGFCVKRGELIKKLSSALKESGFKENEIRDFSSYWSIKIPSSERYCVYPQTTSELQQSVRLEIEPKPELFKQLLFIVQVGENLDGKGKFRRAPVASWKPENAELHREPAAKTGTGIQVREWGIGFLEGRPQTE